ncbi:MAG: DegT/DnrJ/EryC1/StrS family aminotransferase [Ardenticatenaceae bacterium]|nr:DegT/DnrJ/EryC1/StrS family aminotransferase [Ardenticatenaceae bacterium]
MTQSTYKSPSTFRAANRPAAGLHFKVPNPYFGSEYGDEEYEAVKQAMQQEWQTNGPQTGAFEEEFAAYVGSAYAFATTNCTAALHMGAELMQLGPKDEVITTPITFVATSQPAVARGAKVVFADVDPRTFNIDPESIAELITARTRAIFLVHDCGQPCDMDPIMDLARTHNLLVLEDAARAVGATYKGRQVGSFGDVGAFSFHSLKNMTTLGEGGMLTTSRPDYAEIMPMLRSMGVKYYFELSEDEWPAEEAHRFAYEVFEPAGVVPRNNRMSEAQAAVGRVQLAKLDQLNARRRAAAHFLSEHLREIDEITPPYEDPNCTHVFHLYIALFDGSRIGATAPDLRDVLTREEGIQVGSLNMPNYLHRIYRIRGYEAGICPVAERVYDQSVALPIHPRLTQEDLDTMVAAVKSAIYKLKHR